MTSSKEKGMCCHKCMSAVTGPMSYHCLQQSCPCHKEKCGCNGIVVCAKHRKNIAHTSTPKTGDPCKSSPRCSHNTNGRDLDKPCSIEFSGATFERETGADSWEEENWHAIEGPNGMCACGDEKGHCGDRLKSLILKAKEEERKRLVNEEIVHYAQREALAIKVGEAQERRRILAALPGKQENWRWNECLETVRAAIAQTDE